MIRNKLAYLILDKERADNRKLTYRDLAKESGVSLGVITRLMNVSDRVDYGTLSALCRYFRCGIGDLLEYVPDPETAALSVPAADLEEVAA